MMNCQEIADLLDNGEILAQSPADQSAVATHLSRCADCAHQWRAARSLRVWSNVSAPSPRPGLFADAMRRATGPGLRHGRRKAFWLGASAGGALAASLLIALVTWRVAVEPDTAVGAPTLTIALNEPYDVSVAIDSSAAVMGAQIRVVLSGGIHLAGFDDESELSWTTDIEPGANRLTLPVVADTLEGGRLLVEVTHEGARQVFVVDVGVASTAGTAPLAGERPYFVKSTQPPLRYGV